MADASLNCPPSGMSEAERCLRHFISAARGCIRRKKLRCFAGSRDQGLFWSVSIETAQKSRSVTAQPGKASPGKTPMPRGSTADGDPRPGLTGACASADVSWLWGDLSLAMVRPLAYSGCGRWSDPAFGRRIPVETLQHLLRIAVYQRVSPRYL